MDLEHFQKIMALVNQAAESGFSRQARETSGLSGEKLIGALQRLAKYQHERRAGPYLEIGVFQGLTLISVACVLDGATVFGIDNFSQFDPEKVNKKIVSHRAAINGLENICLIDADYEDVLENLESHLGGRSIGLFFVDGPHDYRSQLACLNLARPYLSEGAIIVVDDCNYRHVRLANRDFLLSNPEHKLLFEAYTERHPGNMSRPAEQEARRGWWNGVNVIVHDPKDILDTVFPDTYRDRQIFVNDHIVHGAKYAALAPEAVFFVQSLFMLRPVEALKQLVVMWRKRRQHAEWFDGDFPSMNTYSDQLPGEKYNPALL